MSEILSFPGLGLKFSMSRVAFHLFGRPVYWYGIIIAVGFLAGILYAMKQSKRFGLNQDKMIDVVLGGVIGGIIGARLYYVLFTWDNYKGDLVSVFKIWEGGLAIYGGIIGAFLTGVLICRIRKVKMLPMFDLAAGGLILGQAIGRWGNFVNMEAFGSNTNLPWGMTSPSIVNYLSLHKAALGELGVSIDPSLPVHPTFFYESVWCLLGFFMLFRLMKRRRFDGQMTLAYAAWYGLGRFFIEGLRTDSLTLGTIRVSQVVALVCVIASAIIYLTIRSRIRRENDPAYLMLYVDTEEGQREIALVESQKKDDKEKQGSDTPGDESDREEGSPGETQEEETGGEGGQSIDRANEPEEDQSEAVQMAEADEEAQPVEAMEEEENCPKDKQREEDGK